MNVVHNIELSGYCATPDHCGPLMLGTYGSREVEKLKVTLGDGWEGMDVKVVFNPSGVSVMLPEDGLLTVPWEATSRALSCPDGAIVFQGFNGTGKLINTVDVTYKVLNHSPAIGKEERPATPGIVEAVITEMKKDKEDILDAADRAKKSETNAANSASEAYESKESARRYSEAANSSLEVIQNTELTSLANAERAERAAGAAETSKEESAASASNAALSAENASNSASEAYESATNAQSSATNAANSAANAATSADNSANSASSSATSAAKAKQSETNAQNSAQSSATNALNSANSASQASTSAKNAKKSEDNANTASSRASGFASTASQAAANAANSATSAATNATNALSSANSASSSATQAANSATSAATSASNAATSSTEASTSSDNAANSATSAATSASNAATSATEASNSATDAANSATQALESVRTTELNVLNKVCPPLNETSSVVQCYPVEDYPLEVVTRIDPIQKGTGDPSPDNVRPIKGWDTVEVTRCRENLLDLHAAKGLGGHGLMAEVHDDGFIRVFGTYTSTNAANSFSFLRIRKALGIEMNRLGVKFKPFGDIEHIRRIRCTGAHLIDCLAIDLTGMVQGESYDITFRIVCYIGDTPQKYTPYIGQTFTQSLPETIYGGSYNWATGELVVDSKLLTFNGSEPGWNTWGVNNKVDGVTGFYNYTYNDYSHNIHEIGKNKSSHLIHNRYAYGGGGIGIDLSNSVTKYIIVSVPNDVLSNTTDNTATVASFVEWLSSQYALGTPFQFCYRLAEPITYHLSPQEILSIPGVNTVFSNSGDTTVSGRADPIHLTQTMLDRISALESAQTGL